MQAANVCSCGRLSTAACHSTCVSLSAVPEAAGITKPCAAVNLTRPTASIPQCAVTSCSTLEHPRTPCVQWRPHSLGTCATTPVHAFATAFAGTSHSLMNPLVSLRTALLRCMRGGRILRSSPAGPAYQWCEALQIFQACTVSSWPACIWLHQRASRLQQHGSEASL